MATYIESQFFQQARDDVRTRTGVDLIKFTRLLSIHKVAEKWRPWVFDILKHHATSSVEMDYNSARETVNYVLLWFANKRKKRYWGIRLHGEHVKISDSEREQGHLSHSYSSTENQYFIFQRTVCHIEVNLDDCSQQNVRLRCLCLSDEPLRKFITHCCEMAKKKKLSVQLISASSYMATVQRSMRMLDTIDLEPKLLDGIKQDVEDYFHPGTEAWYIENGTPLRRGYLLYGPGGTGKNSLTAAIACYADVPLCILN